MGKDIIIGCEIIELSKLNYKISIDMCGKGLYDYVLCPNHYVIMCDIDEREIKVKVDLVEKIKYLRLRLG